MNKVYKCIFNEATGQWVVASELAKGKKKRSTRLLAGVIGALIASTAAAQTHYYSVNDNGTPAANYANDGATGTNAVNVAQLRQVADASTTIGDSIENVYNTGTKYFHANSTGADAQATGQDAIAIGTGAVANSPGSLAAGVDSESSNTDSVAIGTLSRAQGDSSAAIGVGSKAKGDFAVALGGISEASGDSSVAIGLAARATADNSVALGAGSVASGATLNNDAYLVGGKATGEVNVGNRRITGLSAGAEDSDAVNVAQLKQVATDSTTISDRIENVYNTGIKYFHANSTGADSQAAGQDAVAIGTGAIANGPGSIAAGINSESSNTDSVAIGTLSKAKGDSSVAIGVNNKATGDFSVALGSISEASGDSSVAIGLAARATADNSVALGAGSVASGATLNNDAYLVGGKATGEVNVGNRRITGLSAGAEDSDAVNVAQLKKVTTDSTAIGDRIENVYNTGTKYFHANSTGADSQAAGQDAVAIGTGAVANGPGSIAAGINSESSNTDSVAIGTLSKAKGDSSVAIGVNNKATGNFSVALGGISEASGDSSVAIGLAARATTANSVALGANSIANASLISAAYNPNPLFMLAGLTPVGEVSVGSAGSERRITNVAAGSADTDAVNVSQLRSAVSAIPTTPAANDRAVKYDGATGSSKDKVTLEGAASTDGGKTGGTTITNVSQGVLSKTSTDAVNGSQLFETNQKVENIDGRVTNIENTFISNINDLENGSRYFKADGTNTDADKATVQAGTNGVASGANANVTAKNGVAIGNSAVSSAEETVAVGANAKASASGATATGSGARASGKKSVATGQNANASANNSVAVGAGAQASHTNSVALGADSATNRDNSVSVGYAGGERQITNMAAGTAPTDGVNVSQLNDAKNDVINYTNGKLSNLRNDANAGTASAMAMAALPQATLPGKGMFSLGGGTYGGQSGMAVGVSGMSESGKWVFKANATTNTRGEVGAGVGVGFHW
ncbi:YadA-like family protein [Achromobacter sp. UMC46]|uniref:YadA-like family protein n=1 Tax=Achromobacter sp. UMC46 TaxID=1862319 RepID=UPI0016014AFA|nr:YadA-like family protein [Achromobacter sp. UMC46]MBB1596875.1 hypothetical protein [Achromobacter sp. UMC46]